MPFRSFNQMKYLYSKHPEIAKKWASDYGVPKNLPEYRMATAKKKRRKVNG